MTTSWMVFTTKLADKGGRGGGGGNNDSGNDVTPVAHIEPARPDLDYTPIEARCASQNEVIADLRSVILSLETQYADLEKRHRTVQGLYTTSQEQLRVNAFVPPPNPAEVMGEQVAICLDMFGNGKWSPNK